MQDTTSARNAAAEHPDSVASLMALHDRDARSALRRVLGRSQEEDDLVQEVFVRLVIRLRQPGRLCVGAWVRGVAHNLAVDEIRRRRPVPVDETRLDAAVNCPADDRVAGSELYSQLVEGAKALPDRQRAALASALSGDAGPGVAGVASKLGVSVHAAESLLSRARIGLREHLATAGSDTGSVRVRIGAFLAAVGAVLAWVARQWRTATLATAVAAGAVTTVVSLPAARSAPPVPVVTAPDSAAAPTASARAEALAVPVEEDQVVNDPTDAEAVAAAPSGADTSTPAVTATAEPRLPVRVPAVLPCESTGKADSPTMLPTEVLGAVARATAEHLDATDVLAAAPCTPVATVPVLAAP